MDHHNNQHHNQHHHHHNQQQQQQHHHQHHHQQQHHHHNQQQQQQQQKHDQQHHNQQQQSNNRQETITSVLPKGWRREEVMRKTGLAAGKVDIYYYSNDGKKFKTKYEMQKFLGDKHDLSLFDFKTGKLSTVALRKQKRLKNPVYMTKNVKYDSYLNLPIRQTASIFKQPVTCITNHKNETPKIDNQTTLKYAEKLKPIQLFWELRFDGMKSMDSFTYQNQLNQDIELKNISTLNNFEMKTDSLIRSVAASLYLNQNQNKAISGQEKEFSKNPRVFIERDQPLIHSVTISEDEIKKQENRVKDIRKSLQDALDEYNKLQESLVKCQQ